MKLPRFSALLRRDHVIKLVNALLATASIGAASFPTNNAVAAENAKGSAATPKAQATVASGEAIDALKAFSREAKAGRAKFTQTVISPDGAKRKTSSGEFQFQRPNRFRFFYQQPYEQTIVSDGQKVWFHDPDLNQVTVRKLSEALGSTPAALLTGQDIERDFELQSLPSRDGLAWVKATPHQKSGTLQSMQLGFRGKQLAALELADSFGQRSVLIFTELQLEASLPADTFKFTVPAGADVSQQ